MIALKALSERKNSPRGKGFRFIAAALVGAGLGLAALSAEAAPTTPAASSEAKSARGNVTALAAKDPETTSSIQTGAGEADNCARSRRRLFVEGEGWIVRRVTTCY